MSFSKFRYEENDDLLIEVYCEQNALYKNRIL